MAVTRLREFLKFEAAGGIILMLTAVLAIVIKNSSLASFYDYFLEVPFTIALGTAGLSKPVLFWINDGLMAIFFLLVGLELKREVLEGHLASRDQIVLPVVAAIGGMVVPALVFLAFNHQDPALARGWAIPSATDIAFALGVMLLLGDRVPVSLKVLLTSVAVIDDLGAIVIIAIFYTSSLSVLSLVLSAAALIGLYVMNRRGVVALAPYLLLGAFLWVCVLNSGVHATLAGVAIAFAIPLRATNLRGNSPARVLEKMLHPWVAYGILPLFAFVNAGLPLLGLTLQDLFASIPLGIALGLILGKPVGIMLGLFICIGLFSVRKPEAVEWSQLFGMSILTGIGFTMSLFIGGLAYTSLEAANEVRLGVLVGSIVSGVSGYLVLRMLSGKKA
ncbi:Na+/H+ antiporter NhaA [Govanella unica]|uniref:Na(+)/H(+) antiporter NhaA n=1 Tax=Govanella unica TaxID=2975056 RepID=A0A9X3TV97_9PROT|nr:Na+/H+ antiporter NhaA [Govania unica]MDA5192415.1 Na+/H+ antiporter NhaA [Govania unica]